MFNQESDMVGLAWTLVHTVDDLLLMVLDSS